MDETFRDVGQWRDRGAAPRYRRGLMMTRVQCQQFRVAYYIEGGNLIPTVGAIRWKTDWRATLARLFS